MPLFGRNKDRQLIKHFSKEVMSDVIDTPVILYKPNLSDSAVNIYGEGVNGGKSWRPGIELNAMVERQDQEYQQLEYGIDLNQKATFSFLNEDIWEKNKNLNDNNLGFAIEIGDIIYYDANYWEIDAVVKNQYLFGRNEFLMSGDTIGKEGESLSTKVETHLTRLSKINIEEVKESTNIQSNDNV